jgi:hypothetical protein
MGFPQYTKPKRVNNTIFIPLPKDQWVDTSPGRCVCGHCDGSGSWDTLAVAASVRKGEHDRAWLVHYPELHKD